jgi:hypothetical protein
MSFDQTKGSKNQPRPNEEGSYIPEVNLKSG